LTRKKTQLIILRSFVVAGLVATIIAVSIVVSRQDKVSSSNTTTNSVGMYLEENYLVQRIRNSISGWLNKQL
jgi:flagellar basal body-associated protein FliL